MVSSWLQAAIYARREIYDDEATEDVLLVAHLPSHCVCGKDFSISYDLSCARLLSEVCHDVQVEPLLTVAAVFPGGHKSHKTVFLYFTHLLLIFMTFFTFNVCEKLQPNWKIGY